MNYIDLSLEKLSNDVLTAADDIVKHNSIDIIIYVAKAGYPIAKFMNEKVHAEIIGIEATRKGNKLKSYLGWVFKYCPRIFRDILITIELKSKIHKNNIKRNVSFHGSIDKVDISKIKNVLVVDDSVDTGYSMKEVVSEVRKKFPGAEIYTYALNVWHDSVEVFDVDYSSYRDTVIRAPMSKDSKEYNAFYDMYINDTKNGMI